LAIYQNIEGHKPQVLDKYRVVIKHS